MAVSHFVVEPRLKLTISKEGDGFLVCDRSKCGSPPVGRGKTMMEAIGSFFHHNQYNLGIEFDVGESAQSAETARRRRELARR